ncbi:DUF6588 family protein [Patiriisocius sp. Uisw_047]|uniref:DUF6588 family protein n=1 Tax=Patiriisocius sp. Uisw_047 TaxID=3230969 RepID=UPI0039ED4152
MKKWIFVGALLSFFNGNAQDLESILLAAGDANQLINQYIEPALKGLTYSVNGGWYTSAETHKKFGFDVTIAANAAFVPNKDKTFLFNPSDYTFLSAPSQNNENLPTVLGQDGNSTMVDVRVPVGDGTFKIASFEMPGGVAEDLPASGVLAPTIQVGFGLPTKTDIKLRLVPNLNYDDRVAASLFGLGLQHDLSQYFPLMEVSPLSLSVLGAFTTTKAEYELLNDANTSNVNVINGVAEFKLNTWMVQAIAGVNLKIINFYASAGYNSGNSTLKLLGDYTLSYDLEDENGSPLGTVSESLIDPININADTGGVRGTVGMRVNLSVFKLFADFTLQEYNTVTAGIAVSVR